MKLTLRTLDGELSDLEVELSDYINSVATKVQKLKKPDEKVYVRLVHDGRQLPPGCQVHECGLSDGTTVDVIWSTWKMPEMLGRQISLSNVTGRRKAVNGTNEVLLRREKMDVLEDALAVENLDFSGTFAKQGAERQALAMEFISRFTPLLRVLDIRQCGFDPPTLLAIFEKLPGSLEELWASRNHFDAKAMQSLRHLSLRVVDVGYSECSDLGTLPDLVCETRLHQEKTEQLILGDLDEMVPETFTASLEKCPLLRHLDIYNNYSLEGVFASIATLPMLRKLESRQVDCEEKQLNQVLSRCTQLEHLCLSEISSSSSIQLLGKLENLKVLQTKVATLVAKDSLATKGGYPGNHDEGSAEVSTNQLVCEICQLKVDTLALGLVAEEDECPTTLSENVEPVVEALKNCMASCISLEADSVAPAVLEAVGSRLCDLSTIATSRFSLISSLLEVKQCCSNLVSLSINYFEHIDGKQLALLAAACPLLQSLYLNADDDDFQRDPIDEGVLGLGQHCHMLETLDLYDRIMKDPCQTLKTASVGWPRLRYLCIANCNMDGDWKITEMTGLPQIIAKNCPKLQEFAVYDGNMRSLFDPVLNDCPLYGPLLSYDSEDEDSEGEGSEDEDAESVESD